MSRPQPGRLVDLGRPQPGRAVDLSRLGGVTPASWLQRPALPTVSSGIAEVDRLTGGLPRGALTEICGQASSGRSSLLLAALADTTRRQEICALVDTSDSFDPVSAAAAGIDLERLLWIRCGGRPAKRTSNYPGAIAPTLGAEAAANVGQHANYAGPMVRAPHVARQAKTKSSFWWQRLEQALKATDLLLQGGGFGLVAIDLADVPPQFARRVPLASWFRFQRAVEHTSTVLVVIEQEPYAKTCASLVLTTVARKVSVTDTNLEHEIARTRSVPGHAQLFRGFTVEVEVVRSRLEGTKKPSGSAGAGFATANQWAG